MKVIPGLRGSATGIASLPQTDPKEAVDLVFSHCPDIPFWPQLPKRSSEEGMVAQFSENIPCLKLQDKQIIFAPEDKDKLLEDFYAKIIAKDIEAFSISRDFSAGLDYFLKDLPRQKNLSFIKGQVTGPFTFAASINDSQGVSLLHNQEMMEVIVNALTMKALWQINKLKAYTKNLILFFDEPYLSCFGSAYTSINREDVVKKLNELISPLRKETEILVGIHCCGNTDWSMLMEADIDILNFDAYGYFERLALYASDLKKFLARGGILAWGIVPTQEFKNQSVEALKKQLFADIDILVSKGIDKNLILNQSLITPSCGMGALEPKLSKKILETLRDLSKILRA